MENINKITIETHLKSAVDLFRYLPAPTSDENVDIGDSHVEVVKKVMSGFSPCLAIIVQDAETKKRTFAYGEATIKMLQQATISSLVGKSVCVDVGDGSVSTHDNENTLPISACFSVHNFVEYVRANSAHQREQQYMECANKITVLFCEKIIPCLVVECDPKDSKTQEYLASLIASFANQKI